LSEIRFYVDENVDPTIAEQIVRHGIDAITVRDLGELGDTDINHLQRATEMERVLVTHDADFLRLDAEGIQHADIAFAKHYGSSIGGIVKALIDFHATTGAEDIKGRVKFLKV
jgi:hypothetical protein